MWLRVRASLPMALPKRQSSGEEIYRVKMREVSPAADFCFDFQHLLLGPSARATPWAYCSRYCEGDSEFR
jgi:hypothetical protein